MVHNLETLRTLLESLAHWEIEDHRRSEPDLATMAFSFRECRLDLMRLDSHKLSETQLHRLQQLDDRLQMVVSGHGLEESIAADAKRVLESFGWSTET
jgi:DNA polymerase III sliding clamp (beta) subunit (PCNA family)